MRAARPTWCRASCCRMTRSSHYHKQPGCRTAALNKLTLNRRNPHEKNWQEVLNAAVICIRFKLSIGVKRVSITTLPTRPMNSRKSQGLTIFPAWLPRKRVNSAGASLSARFPRIDESDNLLDEARNSQKSPGLDWGFFRGAVNPS